MDQRRIILIGANNVTDMIVKAAGEIDDVDIVGIVAPGKAGGTRHGISIVERAEGLLYDRAIPYDDMAVDFSVLMKAAGIEPDKLWLM